MAWRPNPRVFYTLFSLLIILLGTLVAIEYAKGGIRLTKNGVMRGTGLLAVNSFPTGAEVYLNDRLTTATDETLYLNPDEYQVKIIKEGYTPWEKKIKVQSEVVSQTNALLFPLVPSLSPLTITGASDVWPSPDGQKILFYSASPSAQAKKGLYVLELSNNPLFLQRGSTQILAESSSIDLSKASYIWSPDSSEIMVIGENKTVLVSSDKLSNLGALPNLNPQKTQLLAKWQEEVYLRERQFLAKFPEDIVRIATASAANVYFSPDKKRLLYTATKPELIPDQPVPVLPGKSTQAQVRQLKVGDTYVYDREEDTNFLIQKSTGNNFTYKKLIANDLDQKEARTFAASPSAFMTLQATNSAQTANNWANYHSAVNIGKLQWFPDSKHLVYAANNELKIVEYDGANDTVVYSGPFAKEFVFPWPDGSRLIMLANFSNTSPLNLYSIELK